MINLREAFGSTIGRKFLNGLTAIGLVVFLVLHLGGNLTLLISPEAFNSYAAKLHGLGILLYVLEIGLLAAIVLHVVYGVLVWAHSSDARSEGYRAGQTSKKGPSNYSLSSTKMIVSGLGLLGFLALHLAQFRLKPFYSGEHGHDDYYKELYTMVDTAFADPIWVGVYCAAMIALVFHLRHGLWSMLQTVGAMNSRWKQSTYGLAFVVAALFFVGFIFLPIGLYLNWIPFGA